MSNYDLRDAFQELVALNEAEEFNLSDEEQIKKMADFMDGDEYDEVQMVIDVDAEGMDELEPSYEGKIILQCPVCKSLIYKDEADIVEDSESDYVNVEDHCPYCKEEGGMLIVGKVAPYPTHEEEKVEEPAEDSAEEPVESEEETEVEIEEPVQESLTEEVGVQKFGDEDDPERYHSANWYIGGRNNFELSTDALGGAKRGDAVRYTASRWSHTYHNTQEMEDDIKNLQTLIAEVKKLEAKGFVNSELNESLKEDLTVDEQAKVNEIVDQFLRDACAEIAVRDIDYKKENILKAAQAFVDDFFFMSESLNEDVNGELAMAELKDLVAMHIYNRFLESFDDNMAQEIAHRIPTYDVDWCNEEGDNFLANAIETKKKALARAITDALFANAPRELPECLTESDMPAEESENIVYKDSRRNNFYLWRNGKRYEAETIEKLKEILKSKDEDCKLKEGEVCPKCGKSPCECKECADTKLTEASEVIDRKGFATLIKYSDPVFANASHGVLNDGNFCYKFWAKDDDEAKKIFAERGVECDESLTEDSTTNYIVCAYTDDNYDYVDSWAFLKNADLDYSQLEDLQKVGDAWCGEDEDLYWSFDAKDPAIKKFKKKDALKVCELLDQTDTRGMYLIPLSEKALEARLEEAEDGDFTESLEEGVKSELDYNEAVDFVEEAGISLDVAGSDFANYVIDDFEALEDENGKFSKADLKKFITYAKKKAKEFEDKDLYEDLDTESLDKLISEKLGKQFVTESAYVDGNKITVENKEGESFIFEAKEKEDGFKLINEKFTIKGKVENKNIICEAIEDIPRLLQKATYEIASGLEKVRQANVEAHDAVDNNESLEEAKNPNFDEEKYGKYFEVDEEGNYKLKPELADEYFHILHNIYKELEDKEEVEECKEDCNKPEEIKEEDCFEEPEAIEEAALTEKKWDISLESGKALRTAIDGEDGEEIKAALKDCYREINRKMPEEFDEDELESMLDDLDMADFSENEEVGVDAEEAEDNVNAYLGDFYDFCDGYNIWVEV